MSIRPWRNPCALSCIRHSCGGIVSLQYFDHTGPTFFFCCRVDRADQLVENITSKFRFRKWYKPVFMWLVSTACNNTTIIHRDGLAGGKKKLFTMRKGVDAIIEGLLQLGNVNLNLSRRPIMARNRRNTMHLPVRGKRQNCFGHHLGHGRTTIQRCRACDIPLCNRCFAPYHDHTFPGVV